MAAAPPAGVVFDVGSLKSPLRDGLRADTLDVPLGPEIGQCCGGRVEVALRVVDAALIITTRRAAGLVSELPASARRLGASTSRPRPGAGAAPPARNPVASWSLPWLSVLRKCERPPDAAAPDLLVLLEQPGGGPDGVDVAPHEPLATALLLGHQPCSLEHRDVLLHGGERHRVALGEGRHRCRLAQHPRDDVAAGGVGEGTEDPVHVLLLIYNHQVVR